MVNTNEIPRDLAGIEVASNKAYKNYLPLPIGSFILGVCDDEFSYVMDPSLKNRPMLVVDGENSQFARWVVAQALIENSRIENSRISAENERKGKAIPVTRITVATSNLKNWRELNSPELAKVNAQRFAVAYKSGRLAQNTSTGNKIIVIDPFERFAGAFVNGEVNESVKGFMELMKNKPNGSRRSLIINLGDERAAEMFIRAQEMEENQYILIRRGEESGQYLIGDGIEAGDRFRLLPEVN